MRPVGCASPSSVSCSSTCSSRVMMLPLRPHVRTPTSQHPRRHIASPIGRQSRILTTIGKQYQHVLLHAVVGFQHASSSQALSDIEMQTILDLQGMISPDVPDGAQASVFAVYDARQKLQYIGFSKDIRNSLRTVFSRRPDKTFFYKALHLPAIDQQEMIKIRDAWFEESGGSPPGNHLAMERTAWQQPVDAGAISQRGKKGAAEEMATQILKAIKDRGCKEEFIPNPTLLEEGMVDFLPAAALDKAEMAARRAEMEALAKLTRPGHVIVDGQEKTFNVFYGSKFPTNNGFMMDVTMTYDNQETHHRIIIGKEYYEEQGIEPEKVIEAALGLILEQKLPRQTEGMLQSSQFPTNYFSVSAMEQWFGEVFNELYERCTGVALDAEFPYWRFNRVQEYGALNQTPGSWRQISVGKY